MARQWWAQSKHHRKEHSKRLSAADERWPLGFGSIKAQIVREHVLAFELTFSESSSRCTWPGALTAAALNGAWQTLPNYSAQERNPIFAPLFFKDGSLEVNFAPLWSLTPERVEQDLWTRMLFLCPAVKHSLSHLLFWSHLCIFNKTTS